MDPDDFGSKVKTDHQGYFTLIYEESETHKLKPYLIIKHHCNAKQEVSTVLSFPLCKRSSSSPLFYPFFFVFYASTFRAAIVKASWTSQKNSFTTKTNQDAHGTPDVLSWPPIWKMATSVSVTRRRGIKKQSKFSLYKSSFKILFFIFA